MHRVALQAWAFSISVLRVLVWPTAVTTAIHHSSSPRGRKHRHGHGQWNQRGLHHKQNRRSLTTEERIHIPRLDFIPSPSKDDEYLNSNGVTLFNRGGNLDVATKRNIILSPLAFASIMALLAGYSHVLCLQKFRTFAAMMSGNIISMSIDMAGKRWNDALWKSSLFGGYFLGTASVRSIELLCHRKGHEHLKIVAPIVAVVFATAEKLIGSSSNYLSDGKTFIFLLTLGYGMVYASVTQALNGTITQLLTGHLTKLGSAIPDRFLGPTKQWNKGIMTSVCILGSFVIGCTFGSQVLHVVSEDFPVFAILGSVYALVLTMF